MLQQSISRQAEQFDPSKVNFNNSNTKDQQYSSDSDSDLDTGYEHRIEHIKKQNHITEKGVESTEGAKPKGKLKAYHQNHFTKLDTKINLHKIQNEIESCEKKQFIKQKRNKDKADRATVEQVLDERTRRILLKLLNNQIVSEINGCLSTGKEANVYHAVNNTTKKEYAIKIYKTSILVFKDRDRYVEGEFRFRRGYCSSNPRKMVSMWAEKQLRNLKRMEGVLPCPVGLLVKSNVLVMDFIGKDMLNAPRLKDTDIKDIQRWSQIYLEVIKIMRVLYQECKLIHADFSEYNLLYWEDKVYVIDVSQSVEHDHPHALDFLRRDITNINDFFKRKHVNIFTSWHLFQFIVALDIPKGQQIEQLEHLMELVQEESKNANRQDVEENIFRRIAIPRTLGNISMQKVEKELFVQQTLPFYHKAVTGAQDHNLIREEANQNSDNSSESSSDSDSEQEGENNEKGEGQTINKENQEGDENARKVGGKQKYQGLSKLERKHKVKEDKRQKRKQKIPKKQKKRLTKKH